MNQLDLFGDEAKHVADLEAKRTAAKREPSTSKESYDDVQYRLVGLRNLFLLRLDELGEATANEVSRGDESIRKRAKELVDLELIEVTGKRKCNVSGKTCQTYGLL